MKQFKSFTTMTAAVSILTLLFSCGSGDEKTTKETTQDTTQVKAVETPLPTKPANVLIVKPKVANFSKWKTVYEAHDSLRRAYGLASYVVGRGLNDSNKVVVFLKMDDVAKAKEYTGLKSLKVDMQKVVTGPPSFTFVNVVMDDDSKIEQTDRLMVTHKVKDWDAWKKEFDDHKSARNENGLIDRGVGYSVDDPKSVTIVFAVTDMKKASAFLKSKDLKDKMAKAGVVGPPSFFFYKIVEKY